MKNRASTHVAVANKLLTLPLCVIVVTQSNKIHQAGQNWNTHEEGHMYCCAVAFCTLPSPLLSLIILIWFLNNWPLTLPLWIYRFNLLRKMTPSGTLNLKNNTYILYYSDLRNIWVKVWFPLCISSIPLEGILQEFDIYLVVTKSLIRSLLLDLPDIILHISRIWLHWITTQDVLEIDVCPFLSPQLCSDCKWLSLANSNAKKRQICAHNARVIVLQEQTFTFVIWWESH